MTQKSKTPTWDLSSLYKGLNDPQINLDKNEIKKSVLAFTKSFKGKINSEKITAKFILKSLIKYELISEKAQIYLNYASLLFSKDTNDAKVLDFYTKAEEFGADISAKLAWYPLELQGIPEQTTKKLLTDRKLEKYKHFLKHLRVFAPYKKSEAEEVIITKMGLSGADAFVKFYDEVSSSEKFSLEGKKLNYSELAAILKSHPNREKRKKAAESYTETFKENAHFYTFVLNNLLLDKKTADEIRGYSYPQQATFLGYEVSPKIVESLVSSVQKRHVVSESFYKSKSKILKTKLYEWDRYSPVYTSESKKFTWSEAQEIVLDSFSNFSDEFASIAKMFFEKRWIDAEVTPHKRSGAFCSFCVPSKDPFILVNFTGEIDDVTTLAHELGHGVHAYLSRENSLVNYHASTAVAEIASVFCESLVFETLLENTKDKKQKVNLLANKIQGSLATIFRQIAFYEFESAVHKHRREKGLLTTENLNTYFQDFLKPMFGKALTLSNQHAYWWMPVLHFYHYNFYVFTYAFGEALTNALYSTYKKEGSTFAKNYIKALKLGGSVTPAELVSIMGIDINDKGFWSRGIDIIEGEVSDFAKIALLA